MSGGQLQRLALARLIFRDASLWILDEPTSALDPAAEEAVFSEVRRLLAGRTGIIMSHRFSTVWMADRILPATAERVGPARRVILISGPRLSPRPSTG